ncbi:sugar kinase [Actinoalloteichus sp. AHMU CJ021]|nr:sugar kinase [Actinoalloteichus sp. AHMU CJ021]
MFRLVLTDGPVRRGELVRRTGLSQPSITKITRAFLDRGYLAEVSPGHGRNGVGGRDVRIGRPSVPLDVRADREFVVGVKVTANELIGVVTDLRAHVRHAARNHLSGHDVADVVGSVAGLVDELRRLEPRFRVRTHALGVSVAGAVDRDRGIARYEPFHGWRDLRLADLLSAETGLPTVVDNDVRALTEAENWFGVGARADSFLLVTVGAGVTGGLVVDGRVRTGAFGVAGELGHVPVDPRGPRCYCGATGCLEAVASEPAIVRRAAELLGEPDLALPDLVRRAQGGDARVRGVFEEAGRAVGRAAAGVVNLLGPEVVVVSADHQAGLALLEPHLRAALHEASYGAAGRAEVVVRLAPFEEWARGAAAVAIARRIGDFTSPPG